jgi:polyribonucleotide nucleotidyltransferase
MNNSEFLKEIISTRGPKLELSSGKLARLADGTAVARQGEINLVFFSSGKLPSPSNVMFPFQVGYR